MRAAHAALLAALGLALSPRLARAQEPPAPAPAPAAPEAPAPDAAPPPASPPLAGWHNGTFYLRDPNDDFRLYVQGRLHVDFIEFGGDNVGKLPPGSALKGGFFLRRVRLELAGEFFKRWQWMLAGELSSANATDNLGAANDISTCGYNAAGVNVCSNQTSPVEAATVKPIPTDAFVNYAGSEWFNVQIGQYLLPFTFENRISDNTTPFLERSVPVRDLAAPTQRDIGAMVWGDFYDGAYGYRLGFYDGDGPNRPNQDGRFDYIGRLVARPLAHTGSFAKALQLGVSLRAGSRDPALIGYDMTPLTTQGGYAFWKPTYKDSLGRLVHILPSAWQQAAAADVLVPFDRVDFTAEGVVANFQTREAVDGAQLSPYTERTGSLSAWSTYAQLAVWIFGDRSIIGFPGTRKPLHVNLDGPVTVSSASQGLEVLAKWEHLEADYEGASRGGKNDKKTPNGTTQLDTASFGVNYWATKHVRVTANYVIDVFPKGAGSTTLGNLLHEVSGRVGIQF